jgi:hypothetical protein
VSAHIDPCPNRLGVSRERKLGPALADGREIAEGGIHATSKRRVALLTHAVSGQLSTYRERKDMLNAAWTFQKAEDATHHECPTGCTAVTA